MHELIIRVLQRRASPDEVQALEHWRGSDPRNEREFREISEVWELTASAAQWTDDIEVPGPAGIIAAAAAQADELEEPSVASRSVRAPAWLRRAVLVPLAASLVAIGFGLSRIGSEEHRLVEVTTGEG